MATKKYDYRNGNGIDELTVPHGHRSPGEILSIEEVEGGLSFHLRNTIYLFDIKVMV